MATLKDTVVLGKLSVLGGTSLSGNVITSNVQIDQLKVRTTSSTTSTTYGVGSSGQILTSNGTNAYWNSRYLPYQYHFRYHFQVSSTATSLHNTAYFSLDEYTNTSPKTEWTYAEVVAALAARGFTGSSSTLPASGAAAGSPVSAVYTMNSYVYYIYTSSTGAKYTSYYQQPFSVSVKIESIQTAIR